VAPIATPAPPAATSAAGAAPLAARSAYVPVHAPYVPVHAPAPRRKPSPLDGCGVQRRRQAARGPPTSSSSRRVPLVVSPQHAHRQSTQRGVGAGRVTQVASPSSWNALSTIRTAAPPQMTTRPSAPAFPQ
jgi:hypothetical protein